MYTLGRMPLVCLCAEDLKLMYCAGPGRADSAVKLLIRARLGLPATAEHLRRIQDWRRSGLGHLSRRYKEEDAMRVLARPDLFRVVLRQNPYVRIWEVYRTHHLMDGTPEHTKASARSEWNKVRTPTPIFMLVLMLFLISNSMLVLILIPMHNHPDARPDA